MTEYVNSEGITVSGASALRLLAEYIVSSMCDQAKIVEMKPAGGPSDGEAFYDLEIDFSKLGMRGATRDFIGIATGIASKAIYSAIMKNDVHSGRAGSIRPTVLLKVKDSKNEKDIFIHIESGLHSFNPAKKIIELTRKSQRPFPALPSAHLKLSLKVDDLDHTPSDVLSNIVEDVYASIRQQCGELQDPDKLMR